MKANIHPEYHAITVKMTDGTTYETRSTWGKPGDVLQLDVDPKTHPAWVGGVNLRKTGQMEKFANKFAFLDRKDNAVKPAEAKADAPKTDAPKVAPKAEAPKKEAKAAAPKKEPKAAAAKKDAAPKEDKKAE